ncbi:hypothetical protein BEWA_005010 [Theileria equi strain WA]|uniref:RAP domain-containing protein n=1 Tax=Theileria equi strain WA TaxID=1537102 RepID=L0B0Q3_THEEQ|nr:hypothetical protein BEWA_005010 [Theileria equi strain WA]AFZ81093.1 hypothetical protein BEWA_005010 [Theileria equi strain WA]|eukprot:XP_004830759.1 hypothetical protein BEWA_005010 [Theileria equi strain WA]
MIRGISSNIDHGRYRRIINKSCFSTHTLADANVTPFNFEDIDKLVKKNRKRNEKDAQVTDNHRSIFYSLVKYSKAINYHKKNLENRSPNKDDGKIPKDMPENAETNLALPAVYDIYARGEFFCEKMAKNLGYMNKNMLIVIIKQSLSTYHNTRKKCWHSLSTKALRHCFISDEPLTCSDLVKICASLSKCYFKKLDEFKGKIDELIISQPEWTIHGASQILWSLSHLKLFSLPSFNYLNHTIVKCINLDSDKYIKYSDIHKIASANLMQVSQVGTIHPVLQSIVTHFANNTILLKCTGTKTMFAIVSILPYSAYNDELVIEILKILVRSLYQYSHVQAAQIIYKFAVIHSDLSNTARDLTLELLLSFRDLVLSSDITFIPSACSKLLYTYKRILGAHDEDFVNKCLSDLNANLHLLGPFSLFGSLLCLNSYFGEEAPEIGEKYRESVKHTKNNLLKFDDSGRLSKIVNGELVPLDNVKLWHYGLLSAIEKYDTYDHLFNFIGTLESTSLIHNVKSFALFLLNMCWDSSNLYNRNTMNSIFVIASKLLSLSENVEDNLLKQYWVLILYHLTTLDITTVFEHENIPRFPISSFDTDVILISLLTSGIRHDEDATLACLNELIQRYKDGKMSDAEPIVIKTILLLNYTYSNKTGGIVHKIINGNTRELFMETFYGSATVCQSNRSTEGYIHYLQKCLVKNLAPVPLEWTHIQIFFLQDYPRYMFKMIPLALVGNMFRIREVKCSIWDVSNWFLVKRGWNNLSNRLKELDVIDDSSIYEQLCEGYTNWNISEIKIANIATNKYVGPYLCQFVIMADDPSQNIIVFILADSPTENKHIYHKIRRDILNKFGYNFVELFCGQEVHTISTNSVQ